MSSELTPLGLTVRDLVAGYGKKRVLDSVSLDVPAGRAVAVLGHNSAGKSTLLHCIAGLLKPWSGSITILGDETAGIETTTLIRRGVRLLPQGGRVFGDLTVRENLMVSGGVLLSMSKVLFAERIQYVLTLFPLLADLMSRKARWLSGGQRQVVALACALLVMPRVLLLDEPSLGLAPPLAAELFQVIEHLAADDCTVLVAEQRVLETLKHVTDVYVLRRGVITYSGPAEAIDSDQQLRRYYL